MLTAITGKWTKGATQHRTDVHPFRKHLEELQIGDTIVGGPRTVSLQDISHFGEFTGDTFYAHTDPQAAAHNPLFSGIVAHGYPVVSLAAVQCRPDGAFRHVTCMSFRERRCLNAANLGPHQDPNASDSIECDCIVDNFGARQHILPGRDCRGASSVSARAASSSCNRHPRPRPRTWL